MKETPRGTTGMFTIHFDVDQDTHELLTALGRKSKSTANQVAHDVMLAWMRDTEKAIIAAQKQKEESEKRIVLP